MRVNGLAAMLGRSWLRPRRHLHRLAGLSLRNCAESSSKLRPSTDDDLADLNHRRPIGGCGGGTRTDFL